MRRTAASVIIASLMLSTSALASGYGLRDVSAATLGISYAGGAANGTRASTMYFNPALVNDVGTFDVAVSNVGLLPDTKGTFAATTTLGATVSGDTTPKDIVNTALIPSIALRYRLTDKVALGFTMAAPWGMITDYGDTGVTRYYATMSDVKSVNFSPIIGYQVTPELSFAGGLQVQYIKGRLGKAIDFGTIGYLYGLTSSTALSGHDDGFVELRAQAWTVGYVLGMEWKPRPDLSVGVSYRSEMDNTLKGNEYFTLDAMGIGSALQYYAGMFEDGQATSKFTNPSVVTFGARWQVNDQWTLLAGGDWTGWSTFSELTAHAANPYQSDDVTIMDWKNSWFGSIGVEYKPVQDWTLRLGTAYDQTPTINEYRTPGIPDGSRYWFTGGVGYQITPCMDINLSLAYLKAQKAKIALLASDEGNAARGNLAGTVNMSVTMIGLEVGYHL